MKGIKYVLFVALAFVLFSSAPKSQAQISVGVGLGVAPVCAYGYYDYAPYNCAPYGYYGPSWFNGGLFIGAGPWFHGPGGFYGGVNHAYDPRYGYHGALPARGGAYHAPADHFRGFHASHMSNGRGNERAAGGHR